jgi:hypothetical protein
MILCRGGWCDKRDSCYRYSAVPGDGSSISWDCAVIDDRLCRSQKRGVYPYFEPIPKPEMTKKLQPIMVCAESKFYEISSQ